MDADRKIGEEILQGVRELNCGDYGRVTNVAADDDLYEVVDGKRVQLAHSPRAAWIVSRLAFPLGNFVCAQQLGWSINHALFHLPAPINRDRRPDVAFVSYERWAKTRRLPHNEDAWDAVPNLAVEVVSPPDTAEELEQKIGEYFRAGVELVGVVYPTQSKIYVYHSPTKIIGLTRANVLDGGAVVPGFKLALDVLFTDIARPSESR